MTYPAPRPNRVLLVEADTFDASAVHHLLASDELCQVTRVDTLRGALATLAAKPFDCVLLDLELPDSEGLVSLETLITSAPDCPVVVVSTTEDSELAIDAVERGAQDCLFRHTANGEVVRRAIRYAIARSLAENELVRIRERLHSMQEREEIARDLHDTVIQRLFASGMTLQAAMRLPSRESLVNRAEQVVDEIDDVIRELRAAILGLTSPTADDIFARELASIAENYGQSLAIDVAVRLGDMPDLDAQLRADALAVVREALANVARHAQATTATLTVHLEGSDLVVRVSDDGIGIVEAESHAAASATGFGLKNLAARAQVHGGSMTMRAGAHGGSELTWRVPAAV